MSIHRRAAVSLIALLSSVLAACGTSSTAAESPSGIELSQAWARTSQPGAKSGAAHITITAGRTDRLDPVAVDPSIAGQVQLHQTLMADGSPARGNADGGDRP